MKDYLEKNKEYISRWIDSNEQGRVDIKILPYLKDIENGFFVEAGALDGVFMSNTKVLEELGWSGLLIEPSRPAYLKCLENRKCSVEWCALVSKNEKRKKISGDFFFDGHLGVGAWSSINKNLYGQKEKIYVPAKTLDEILKKHGVKKIDFLSLDVEGYEMNVLKGIDFDSTEITYMLIEINFNDYSLEDMDEYLESKGYKNLGCLSNFSKETNEGWDGGHQDYLYGKSR